MASDVIEIEGVLISDMNVNNSNPDFVPPRRTHEDLGIRQTSSPSSSGVSGEGDDEDLHELQSSTASTIENGEEAFQDSQTKTRGTPQERTTTDNAQEQSGGRSSTPVSLPQPRSPSGPIGRSVFIQCDVWPTCWLLGVICRDLVSCLKISVPEADHCCVNLFLISLGVQVLTGIVSKHCWLKLLTFF